MHTRSFVAGAVASTLAAATATAQGPVAQQCQSQPVVAVDACQKAVDLFHFMAPQLGTSITGGNAVIGSAGTLGGLGHFSVGLRANVVQGQLPRTDGVSLNLTGARVSDFNPRDQAVGLPTAEAAIGLFRGVNVGMTNVGGVDALVSAFYVPDIDKDPVSVAARDGGLKLGYGVRVGVLQETAFVPGMSISYLRRDLPTVDIRARIGTADSVRVTDLGAKTTAVRLAAAKSFTFVGFTAGVGRDVYDAKADAGAYIAPRQVAPGATLSFDGRVASVSQKLTRTNLFAGASLNLSVLRIAAELGRVTGGDVPSTFNDFGESAATSSTRSARPYTYGSLGVRIAR